MATSQEVLVASLLVELRHYQEGAVEMAEAGRRIGTLLAAAARLDSGWSEPLVHTVLFRFAKVGGDVMAVMQPYLERMPE